ncbi:MAG: hypothetical protein HY235_27755 [Acidobacteria bacterium]|nr:hypothetical protein [Acidobacteriota bacterium]
MAALPAAPAGWEITPPPAAPGPPALCTSTPQGGFAITTAATYRWSKAPSFGWASFDETLQVIGAEKPPAAPSLKVYGVRLRLRGFPAHRDTILTAVDKAKLQSLLR